MMLIAAKPQSFNLIFVQFVSCLPAITIEIIMMTMKELNTLLYPVEIINEVLNAGFSEKKKKNWGRKKERKMRGD